jgi:hypothetical protein
MTAIMAYSNFKEKESIGFLAADNWVIYPNKRKQRTKAKADKLSKIHRRFTIAVAGLEIVDNVIEMCLRYFDQFDNIKPKIETMDDLASFMHQYFSYSFPQLKNANIYSDEKQYTDMDSELIILDCQTNKLYYSNIGRVWEAENRFDIKFIELAPGNLYWFGLPVSKEKKKIGYEMEALDSLDESEIRGYFDSKLKSFKMNPLHKDALGNLGAQQINVLGTKPYSKFLSTFSSPLDFVNNFIRRQQ